jgi:two-component system response regulator HydG
MPTSLQIKFLRVLQEGEVRRVGANQAATVDVRVLAATNRDLGQLMQQGKVREDLFYRLNVISVMLPSLRERREDILPLAEYFLGHFGQKQGRLLRLTAAAEERLLRYPWPGNVRELENAMERTVILARRDPVGPDELPPHIAAGAPLGAAPALLQEQTLAEVEKSHILQTLERYGWNHSRAAEALGIGRTSLWRKLKEYQIEERWRERGDAAPEIT